MDKYPSRDFFTETTDVVFFSGGGKEGEGRNDDGGEGGSRHTRDNIPCSSLADAVN